MTSECIEFEGIKYYRYPDSENIRMSKYFRNTSKNTQLHREIWKSLKGDIPKGYHIHHIDGNSLNNHIDNLECLTPHQHSLAHVKLGQEDPSKDIHEKSRKWHASDLGSIHHKEIWQKREKETFNCVDCSIEFEKYRTNRLTGRCAKCRNKMQESNRKPRPRIKKEKKVYPDIQCAVCNQISKQTGSTPKVYCSRKCKEKARAKKRIDIVVKNCLVCNIEFKTHKYRPAKTCSMPCRNEFLRRSMLKVR